MWFHEMLVSIPFWDEVTTVYVDVKITMTFGSAFEVFSNYFVACLDFLVVFSVLNFLLSIYSSYISLSLELKN